MRYRSVDGGMEHLSMCNKLLVLLESLYVFNFIIIIIISKVRYKWAI